MKRFILAAVLALSAVLSAGKTRAQELPVYRAYSDPTSIDEECKVEGQLGVFTREDRTAAHHTSGTIPTSAELYACTDPGPRGEAEWAHLTVGDAVSVNSTAASDADFVDGDIDWTITTLSDPDQVTGTVACSGCVNSTDITDSTLSEVDLKAVDAAADEECLTYETTTGDFEWQACGVGGGDSITVNATGATDPNFIDDDIDWTLNTAATPDTITGTVACTSCIDSTDLAPDSVTASEITVDAVGSSEIATDAVSSAEIVADAVGSAEIVANAVGAAEIDANAVTASELAADAAGTSEIATDGVGSAEIATDAVTASEIVAGAVGTDELANNIVYLDELSGTDATPVDFGGFTCADLAGGGCTTDADSIVESDLKVVDTAVDEECLTYESTTGDFEWQPCTTTARVTSDVFTTSTSFSDVTGMTFAVVSGKTYHFTCELITLSAATTTAVHLSVNGPTTSALDYFVVIHTGATTVDASAQTAYDTVTNPGTAASITVPARVVGTAVFTASGTLALRYKTEVSGSAVFVMRGSFCRVGPV